MTLYDEFDYHALGNRDERSDWNRLGDEGMKMTFMQMQAVVKQATFAITIDQGEGSQSPTLDKLVVIENVA